MKLNEYLQLKSLTGKDFAALAGIAPSTVTRIMQGKDPTLRTAQQIKRATGGAVGYEDHLRPAEPAIAAE